MKTRIAALTLVLAGTLLAAGCANTIRGAGQDVSNTVDATGHAVQRVAK